MIAPWISTLNTMVDPPISLGVLARKFLRSTYSCVDAGNAPQVGLCPNGGNVHRLLRASIGKYLRDSKRKSYIQATSCTVCNWGISLNIRFSLNEHWRVPNTKNIFINFRLHAINDSFPVSGFLERFV